MTKKCTKPMTVAARVLAIWIGSDSRPSCTSAVLTVPFSASTSSHEYERTT